MSDLWAAAVRAGVRTLDKQTVDGLDPHPGGKPYEVRDGGKGGQPGLLVRIEPSGRKSWFMTYRSPIDGKLVRLRLGDCSGLTLAKARGIAAGYRADVAAGQCPRREKQKALTKQRKKLAKKAARSARRQAGLLRTFLDDPDGYPLYTREQATRVAMDKRIRKQFVHWLDTPMLDIEPAMVEKWRVEMMTHLSAETINKDVALLTGCMRRAVKAGVIPHNPLAGLGSLSVVRDHETVYLTAKELKRLYAVLRARDERMRGERARMQAWQDERGLEPLADLPEPFADHLEPIITVLLGTGLRKRECLTLQWGDIDFRNNEIHLRASGTKSRRARTVAMTGKVRETLKAWRGAAIPMRSLPVFPGATGEPLRDFKSAWINIRKAAGLDGPCETSGRPWRVHDFRHHFCSQLALAGVPLHQIAMWAGHSSVDQTERYAKLRPRDVAQTLIDALDGVT